MTDTDDILVQMCSLPKKLITLCMVLQIMILLLYLTLFSYTQVKVIHLALLVASYHPLFLSCSCSSLECVSNRSNFEPSGLSSEVKCMIKDICNYHKFLFIYLVLFTTHPLYFTSRLLLKYLAA